MENSEDINLTAKEIKILIDLLQEQKRLFGILRTEYLGDHYKKDVFALLDYLEYEYEGMKK